MPLYETKDHVKCGMPFGGLGAGKIEVTPQGLLNAFTFQNNWSRPLTGSDAYPGVLGFHLGFFTEEIDGQGSAKRRSFLLQTVPVLKIPTVKNIRTDGIFPRTTLFYEVPGLGLDISLEVFSPWFPGDIKHSSLPAVFFDLTVKNSKKLPVTVGLLFVGRNISGECCEGRQNRIEESQKSI